MGSERPTRHVRFEREKKAPHRPIEGSWESVLVGLKAEYPEDVFGVADSDHWEEIEEKATMGLKEACFQYFLAGKGHLTLAGMVVNSNRNVKAAVSLGSMSIQERDQTIGRLADFLYDKYPDKYKAQIMR